MVYIQCPFSGSSPIATDGENSHVFDSPRVAGRYVIQKDFIRIADEIEFLGSKGKARLITLLIEKRRLGEDVPEITFDLIERAKTKPNLSRLERANRMIQYLVEYSGDQVGKEIPIMNREMFSRLAAQIECSVVPDFKSDEEEVGFFLKYLDNEGLITRNGNSIQVTMNGFSYLDNQSMQVDSNKIFVAMWFDTSLTEIYNNGFSLGIKDAGFNPVRIDIDRDGYIDKLDDLIIAEIRSSRAVVADFTHGKEGARGSVYFEAGFAYGLAIPVFYTCREDCVDKLHFDTRQYSHIVWNKPEELREQLKNRILASIGKGPN